LAGDFWGNGERRRCSLISVAVDIGRSSVKIAYTNGKAAPVFLEIPSVVATAYGSFADPNSLIVNSYLEPEMFQVEVKETQGGWNKDFASFFMLGRQAQKQGGLQISFSEGAQFHKFGVAVVLYAVARAVDQFGEFPRSLDPAASQYQNVAVAIDLTYSNNEMVSFYSSALKGKHRVALGVVVKGKIVNRDFGFNIVDLYCFQQGYASVFNFIGKKEFDVISKGRGVVIDIGRFTVDLSTVKELTLVNGSSVPFGTRVLVEALQAEIARDGLQLGMDEIEEAFSDHDKVFANIAGKSVKPWKLLTDSGRLESYYSDIRMAINNFVGAERTDYLVLCGGGAYLVHDLLANDFKVPMLDLDYVRANVKGMLAMMTEQL
jgi:hypothetical protein